VPNLETSSVADQTAWFRKLQAENDLPTHIELGNEFYLGMGNDPDSMRRWPDLPATTAVMHAYTQALRPLCPAGTKFAVQAAGSEFYWTQPSQAIRPFQRRQVSWDTGLKPEPWFEAVTIHLYPDSVATLGYPHGATPALTDTFRARLFSALLGRVDAGTDRALGRLAARLPGKEIWITEWNPRGGNPDFSYDPMTRPMNMHLTARMTLAILRHPEVTASLFFMLNFAPDRPFSLYEPDGHSHCPALVQRGGHRRRVVPALCRAGGGAGDGRRRSTGVLPGGRSGPVPREGGRDSHHPERFAPSSGGQWWPHGVGQETRRDK
jgi:hypothetical protein